MSLEGLQEQGQTTESLSGLSSWHFQVVWWHSSQRSFQTNLSLLSWFKNGVKLFWKSLGNFTSRTNRPARSLRINCTSADLPLSCMLPRIPLKHQIAWTGPQSITQSFKWQWRCIFGVTDYLPNNFLKRSPNSTKSRSVLRLLVLDKTGDVKYWHARTNVCQHLLWSSSRRPLKQNVE